MATDLSAIIVIDVEATCWDDDEDLTRTSSEIIEIGVCPVRLGPDGPVLASAESHLVRPTHSEVSTFCTQLTTLTPSDLATADVYATVARRVIAAHKTQRRIVATWGDYDRNMFQKHRDKWQDPYLIGPTHWNVKSLFAVAYHLEREVPVGVALARIGLEFEGTPHRGGDDALNIAKILCHLLRRLQA